MARLTTSEARHEFAEVINRVAYLGERVILHRRGKDVAVIISVEDLALLERYEDAVDIREAKRSLREAQKKGTKPLARVMNEMAEE